ncbi:hypothetical protein WA026_015628 [Henosepilachna vigintioctopunctata]|uniref:Uncharacterized protein n=1 Tax=Henosepilachna vigintioctopunctata TaxID=420089 RepID=A0AAW1VD79_9CUCU
MGVIHFITPKNAIAPDQNIERLKQMPSTKVVGRFSTIELKTFTKKHDTGLKTIKIQNLGSIRVISEVIIPVSDLLWLNENGLTCPNIPGMEWVHGTSGIRAVLGLVLLEIPR